MAIVQSLFSQFVEKYFSQIVGRVTERFNDRKEEEQLLHKRMLSEDYSADMTWKSAGINHSVVAADIVSLGSRLPLKKRGSLSTASGQLPKVGMKYRKDEKDITDMNIMIARGTNEATIAGKMFNDVPKSIKGIDLRNEILFLEGFSTGMCLVDSENNDGTGIRVDYGYKEENTCHAITAPWGTPSATPVTDLQQLFDKAVDDSNAINHIWLSEKRFNDIRRSDEGKDLAARFLNMVVTGTPPTPKRSVMLEALGDEFGATFHIVKSSIRIEKPDGSFDSVKPFAEDNVVATPTENVGRLVYGTLAEETNPVEGVTYEKSGSYILVSEFSNNEPLEEYTASQAICLPVIDGVDEIYILHTDSTEARFSVNPSELSFGAEGGTQRVDLHYDGNLGDVVVQVQADGDWVKANRKGDKILVKVSANEGEENRTATVGAGILTGGRFDPVEISISQTAAE